MSEDSEDSAEQAQRLLDAGPGAPLPPGAARLPLARALKALCYAAWNSAPARAAAAADVLARLSEASVAEHDAGADEIAALADWTAGIAHITQGRMGEAVADFDRAAAAFRRLGQPEQAAQTQVPKIMALSMLGQHAEAAACGEDTQRAFRAQGDLRAAGKVSLNLGSLQLRREAYPAAARQYREAAVLFARVGDHEHSVMADCGLGDALTAQGDFDDALRIYARARLRAERRGLPVIEAVVAESVALVELARGRYREALAGLEAARGAYERLGMPQHLAIAEKQLGDAYLELRLWPEAQALFEQALGKFEALDMPYEQAWTLAQHGRVLALRGQHGPADAAFARAADLFATLGNRVGAAAVALARAELRLAQGEADAAATLAHDAATAYASAGRGDDQVRAELVQADAWQRGGNAGAAGRIYDAALARARTLQLLSAQVRALTGLGEIARERGDEPAARASFEAAIERFEDQRDALPGDELRSAFLGDHLRPYQALLAYALAAHARRGDPASARAVLAQQERVRARALGERLAQRPEPARDDASQPLRTRLNWLLRHTQRQAEEDEAAEPSAALHEELRRLEGELLEQARRQRLATAATAAPRAARGELDLGALQAGLGEHGALVAYGVSGDELYACVLRGAGSVSVHRGLARWPEVLEALRAVRFQIETLRHGAAPLQRHLASLTERTRLRLQRLQALVWAPLAPGLIGAREVLLVPHGALGALPFAALHDGEAALGERHRLAVVPSARQALRGLQRLPVAAQRALVLGESSRLPQAAAEARFVAGLFAQGAESAAHVGAEASLATLQAGAGEADVIHLACHGQFRTDNPMLSALHLADGALTVELAEGLRLRPGLVVLSACETALADQGQGDEMFGLVRAFLVAGASRVLASLWPVDDAVTAAFMAPFYGALRAGAGPAEALQQAQTATRRHHPHPAHWAAFALYGGW